MTEVSGGDRPLQTKNQELTTADRTEVRGKTYNSHTYKDGFIGLSLSTGATLPRVQVPRTRENSISPGHARATATRNRRRDRNRTTPTET